MAPKTTSTQVSTPAEVRPFLKAAAVRKLFGYASPSAFWQFVQSNAVPHIRLNQRNIVFDPVQLEDWIASRTVGKGAK